MQSDVPHQAASAATGARPLLRLFFAVGLVGLVATAAWLAFHDLGELRKTAADVDWLWLPLLPLLTLVNLGFRFLRWNFLLRRIPAYVPLRENLRIFLAGFSMVLTPFYVGEILKAFLLRARTGTPIRQGGAVVVAERLFDLLALLVLLVAARGEGIGLVALFLGGWLLIGPLVGRVFRPRDEEGPRVRAAFGNLLLQLQPVAFIGGLVLSVLAWAAAAGVLFLAVRMVGESVSAPQAADAFAVATPLGAITTSPGGTGVTGGLIIGRLEEFGLPFSEGAVAVILTRLFTYWFAAFLGCFFLYRLMRKKRERDIAQAGHFEELANEYAENIPEHIRRHVLEKKLGRMRPWLERMQAGSKGPLTGADLGCGHGWYAAELTSQARMLAMDLAHGQLLEAGRHQAKLGKAPIFGFVQGNACRLPFADGSLDFAYCINIVHHIDDPTAQREALTEMLRVLKPGGRLFLHEVNVNNPLFRFYMGYVFPLINEIDLGTERWLRPTHLFVPAGARLETVEYFTFLPDFVPRLVLKALQPLEGWLERTPLKGWSAHYMAVYLKD